MIVLPWSWVCALNDLQNSMMLTPCCPSAGPTGGAGLAAPAWVWSLMSPVTFFFLGGIALRVLSNRMCLRPGRVPDVGIPHNDTGYDCAAKNRAGQTSFWQPV